MVSIFNFLKIIIQNQISFILRIAYNNIPMNICNRLSSHINHIDY